MSEGQLTTEQEEWRPVVGFEGQYEVSNLGRVKSLPRFVAHKTNGSMRVHGTILKQIKVMGYMTVPLTVGQKGNTKRVHCLVLEAFVGPRPVGMEARHFPDRDRNNNRANNLRWGTKLENAADKHKDGTMVRGEMVKVGKLTAEKVREIRRLHNTGEYSQEELAEMFEIAQTGISCIVRRKTWKHV